MGEHIALPLTADTLAALLNATSTLPQGGATTQVARPLEALLDHWLLDAYAMDDGEFDPSTLLRYSSLLGFVGGKPPPATNNATRLLPNGFHIADGNTTRLRYAAVAINLTVSAVTLRAFGASDESDDDGADTGLDLLHNWHAFVDANLSRWQGGRKALPKRLGAPFVALVDGFRSVKVQYLVIKEAKMTSNINLGVALVLLTVFSGNFVVSLMAVGFVWLQQQVVLTIMDAQDWHLSAIELVNSKLCVRKWCIQKTYKNVQCK